MAKAKRLMELLDDTVSKESFVLDMKSEKFLFGMLKIYYYTFSSYIKRLIFVRKRKSKAEEKIVLVQKF